jgi:hypothetical protein
MHVVVIGHQEIKERRKKKMKFTFHQKLCANYQRAAL